MNKRDSARILALGCHRCIHIHVSLLLRPDGTSSTSSVQHPYVAFCDSPLLHHPPCSYVPIAYPEDDCQRLVAGGGYYPRGNTRNAPEIYVEFTEVVYAPESRAPRFPLFLSFFFRSRAETGASSVRSFQKNDS